MSDYKEYTVKVYTTGTKAWYLNGKRHREDGPAIECSDGTTEWYLNDKRHREDGPAFEYADGSKSWYLNDECLTEKEFNKRMNNKCIDKVITIEGIQYKLVPTSKEG